MSVRDDDPPHPNFDGIRFQATTDLSGIIAVPMSANTRPPVSFLPVSIAVGAAADISNVIDTIRSHDPQSYLAAFLDAVVEDLAEAIQACRPDAPA